MAPSRDAVNFDFAVAAYPRKALILRGPDGSFDKDCVRPPMNIITRKDEHWVYYLATNERWGARKWDARLGLAKLRLDGFTSLDAADTPGRIVTRPLTFKGKRLFLNADVAENGHIKVGLQKISGEPLGCYTLENCEPITGDHLAAKVKWNGKKQIKRDSAEPIRLIFELKNAGLYSFCVK